MATKQGTLEQHNILHIHWPNDCCLCKLEKILQQEQTKPVNLEASRKQIADELAENLPDLVEQFFPKGKCKERGQAIVFGALLILKIRGEDYVKS